MFWRGSARAKSSQDDPVTEDPYEFQPLHTTSTIRLIKISPEKVKGCIACRVYHFDEEEQRTIQYHALSYLWGDPQPTRQVYLQGPGKEWRPLPLHENLWKFLDHAWQRKLFHQLFWTDRLCLDQNGHEEISEQVPRMHAIYRGAELVVIWLQLKEEEEQFLRKLVKSRHYLNLTPGVWHKKMKKRIPLYQDAIWGAMENPYWERVWIVQEVVVAQKVCVTCRDTSIGLDELRPLLDPFWTGKFHDPGKPSMWRLCEMRDEGGRVPLWKVLRDFTGYQSSRPVDRVYGLLGMVANHDDGSSAIEHIQVDYDKPILHVLLDAMFESSPPLTEYTLLPLCLGPRDTYFSLSLLDDYIADSKTMQRHRDFANFALQAFKALNIIKFVPEASPPYFIGDLTYVSDPEGKIDWKPNLGQSAVLIGLTLAKRTYIPLDYWKVHRQRRGDEWSLWRCATHQSHDGGHAGLESYETVARVTIVEPWDRKGVVEACGEQSQSCDGSTMTCEIPQTRLRLLVESAIYVGDEARLSLQQVTPQSRGLS